LLKFWLRVREVLLENLPLKLLSFAFALGLYAFTHSAEDAQRTFPIDVIVMPPPPNAHRVLVTSIPPVRVTVRGPRSIIDELRAEDLGTIQLDLRSGRDEQVVLEPSMLNVPPGVRATQVEPPALDARWEDEVERALPIQAALTGQTATGYVVKEAPKVDPGIVRARGPRSAVESIQYARAEAFDLSGIARDGVYDRLLGIDKPPPRVTYDIQNATVRVEVVREQLERVFVKVPVQVVGVARASSTPSEVDVHVSGPPEIVRGLRTEQIVPRVDLRSAGLNVSTAGSTVLPISVDLSHCQVSVTPQTAVVRW
jgi:YbbR domain-containing protein